MPRKRTTQPAQELTGPLLNAPKKLSGRQFEKRRRAVEDEAKSAQRQRDAASNGQAKPRRIEPAEITRGHLQMLTELIQQLCDITNDTVMPLEKKIYFRNQTAQAMGKIKVEAEVQAEAEALKADVDQRKDALQLERQRIREDNKKGVLAQVRHVVEKRAVAHYGEILEEIRKLVA